MAWAFYRPSPNYTRQDNNTWLLELLSMDSNSRVSNNHNDHGLCPVCGGEHVDREFNQFVDPITGRCRECGQSPRPGGLLEMITEARKLTDHGFPIIPLKDKIAIIKYGT